MDQGEEETAEPTGLPQAPGWPGGEGTWTPTSWLRAHAYHMSQACRAPSVALVSALKELRAPLGQAKDHKEI